ncbi:MAG: poly-gamma-glutamate biosynthesis protein PgsC [Candidatus Ornithospirochaeta sp.]|nr:poly-gamma-glutamate biosynthesis protein PgsC [Sphaerochaetaceae bacterium]MDY5524428.1 poly-gamma-glutamate biosynthesis protein PgsC [Candidatus Ornithospirochaeta sp.]
MLFSTVALSVILSFLVTELTGLLTGGMVSAGYLAFYFSEPMRILSTFLLSALIALILRLSREFLILYGRRRFMLSILLSILFVYALEKAYFILSPLSLDLRVIGYIIPGLIANDMEKQGIIRTSLALIIVTALVKLLSILGGLL